jgi:hypothetical protein
MRIISGESDQERSLVQGERDHVRSIIWGERDQEIMESPKVT